MIEKNTKVMLPVSIPVSVGGYTGQREEWEEYERLFSVTVHDDKVVLSGRDNDGRQITFGRDDLNAALEVLARYDDNAKPKPVTR